MKVKVAKETRMKSPAPPTHQRNSSFFACKSRKPSAMGRIGGYRRGRGAILVATISLTSCAGFQPHSWPHSCHHPTMLTTRSSTRAHAPSSTALSLSIPAAPAISALATLSISASAGAVADKMKLFGGGGSGTVVSLLVASVLSNIGLAPSSHPLYDICWTKLLPASLAFMLMSGFGGDDNGTSIQDTTEDEVKSTIKTVSIPFAFGCLGSIVGCLLSFVGSVLMSTNTGRWTLPPLDAATAAGCLCSSFIGGTVNLFATARILGSGPNAIDLESLLGSMAAADLLVMALYFAGLTAAVKSSYLQRIFPGRLKNARRGSKEIESTAEIDGAKEDASIESQVSASIGRQLYREIRPATAATFASALAFLIVSASTRFERSVYSLFGIPGMGCAAIAVLSTAVGWALRRIKILWTSEKGQEKELFPWLQKEMNRVCPRLSGLCFNLLFAAIGTAANVGVALRHGPASFLFASSALLVHFVTILLGSLAMTKIIPKVKLSIEELAVASNAAIGGPATAAAFAGSLGAGQDVGGESKRRGLVLAGTTWGVVGYAIGTSLGVWLSKILLNFVLAEGFGGRSMSLHP